MIRPLRIELPGAFYHVTTTCGQALGLSASRISRVIARIDQEAKGKT